MFGSLLKSTKDVIAVFGKHWCGPDKFELDHRTLVAEYPNLDGVGQAVKVYCTATPSTFYELDIAEGYKVTTGSHQEQIAAIVAAAIASGMLSFECSEAERRIKTEHERNALAEAIRAAAVKGGICREDVPLTGPHLIMLCDDMGEAIKGIKS